MISFRLPRPVALCTGLFAFFLACGEPAAAQSPAASPGKEPPAGAVLFNGHATNPARVLVRWKSSADAAARVAGIEQALRTEDAQALGASPTRVTSEVYTNMGGVGYVEFEDAADTQAALARGESPAATLAGSSGAASLTAKQLKSRIAALQATGLFDYVEPDYIQRAYATPSDGGFGDGRLWGLRNTGQSGGVAGVDVQAVPAWDLTTGSSNVIVAVIDTGIRYTHQDLASNMWHNPGEIPGNGVDDDGNGYIDDVFGINAITRSGNPLDDNGHGTHCAGTIGGTANDSGPLVGVAWTVRLMGLKFLNAEGSGVISDSIRCIDYAISKGAHIISGSYGGGGASQAVSDAIERARQANILCVFAAGNETNNNDTNPAYPASYAHANIISVAAVDRSGALATFSNFGATSVDIAAPGVQIFSGNFQTDSSYQTISGTSMATPHVAGVAALLKARNPGENHVMLRERLLGSTKPLAALQGRMGTGGLVQARAAMDAFADGTLEVTVSVSPSPLSAGEPGTIVVRVSDFSLIVGASVTGVLNGVSLVFQDDGIAPDTRAGDGLYTSRASIPAVATGTVTLTVNATFPGKTPFTGNFPLPVVARATNDNFASSSTLDVAASPIRTNNRDTSRETGEPSHAGNTGGRSVWWTWTAPSAGQMQLSTNGSAFDTLLAVYTGNAVNALTTVVANDDAGGLLQSAVSFTASAGIVYRIAVDGYNAANGDLVLNATFTAAGGANTAPSFVRQPASTRVQQGETIRLTAEVAGVPTPTLQWTRNNENLANGGRISGANSAGLVITSAVATDGGEYRLVATNLVATATSLVAVVTVDVALVRPPNDDFAQRLAIVGTDTEVAGTSTGATSETGEPAHAGVAAHRSVWWTWTAPQSGTVSIDTFGSSFDTVLAVYRGTAVGSLTGVAANDDAPGSRQSRVTFAAEAGIQFAIAVDGYGTASGSIALRLLQSDATATPPTITRQPVNTPLLEGFGGLLNVVATGTGPLRYQWWKNGTPISGATAAFFAIDESRLSDGGTYFVIVSNAHGTVASNTVTVTVSATGRPPNDDFAAASRIAPGGEVVVARSTGATRENNEPFHAGGTGNTIWWRWSPLSSGFKTISTEGSITESVDELDTVLAVYTGTTLANLVEVAANDDFDDSLNSEVTFFATAGVDYYIAVGGYDETDFGIVILVTSPAAPVGAASAPVVLLQPLTIATPIGSNVSYIVGMGGSPNPSVQWQRSTNGGANWLDIGGATSLILDVNGVAESQNGHLYRARLSNTAGTVNSNPAMLGVLARPENDNFANAIAIAGGSGVFNGISIGATTEPNEPVHASVGRASVWWTWQAPFSGTAVFDTNGSDFDTVLAIYTGNSVGALAAVASNDDFGESYQSRVEFTATSGTTYRVAVSGYAGDSGSVTLSAPTDVGPALTLQPLSAVPVTTGGTVTISAGATGSPPPDFQWQRSTNGGADWVNLSNDATFSGTATPTLIIGGATSASNGHLFRVVVTNSVGTLTSTQTTLSVTEPVAQMVNLSTRAVSLGGDSVIIPGFAISGSTTKRVLIRAVGPKLADFGVSGVMPDPVLQVFRSGEVTAIASNDNWTAQEVGRPDPAPIGDQVGAFALTPDTGAPTNDTLSAALVLDLAAGAYSTVARDSLDRTGVGIVEFYDVDDENTGGPRLVNVSNRGFVGNGEQAMIPGFAVSGAGARRYLIRAVGPKLADFGLPANTLLADPRLSVRRTVGLNSIEVASNDDWVIQTSTEAGTSADVQIISEQIGAFALGAGDGLPTDDQKSAALIVWLEPGVYTVVASGAAGGTGLAIAEVYEVP